MSNQQNPEPGNAHAGATQRRWAKIAGLAILVLLLAVFVVRPLILSAWDKVSYEARPAASAASNPDSFSPSRIVKYEALIGGTVKSGEDLLGYSQRKNLYQQAPVTLGAPGLGSDKPEGYKLEDLTIVAVCQTLPAERALSGKEPKPGVNDRIYFATFPTARLSAAQLHELRTPTISKDSAIVIAATATLQKQTSCYPNDVQSIAVR
ncbi:hypothetical protein [Gordonia sp. CPCC 205333]|uniref:hypothetical protein n=1 Tax=Gordonia sp. CPCC 205333 TaxID=3140790 RepID=UPI003AF3CD49